MNVAALIQDLDEATVNGNSVSVGVQSAESNFNTLLKLVAAGYAITITNNGDAVASLSATQAPKTRLDELIAADHVILPRIPRLPLASPMANPWGGSPFTDEIIRERRGLPD